MGQLQVLALEWDRPARTHGPAQLVEGLKLKRKHFSLKRKQPNEHKQQKTKQTTHEE